MAFAHCGLAIKSTIKWSTCNSMIGWKKWKEVKLTFTNASQMIKNIGI